MRPVTTVNEPRSSANDTSAIPRDVAVVVVGEPADLETLQRLARRVGRQIRKRALQVHAAPAATSVPGGSLGTSARIRPIDTSMCCRSLITRPISVGRYIS